MLLGTRFCRTLSGQRYPDLSVKEGVARASDCIKRALEYAERRDVVLCIENHYKDGTWRYPEFAQQEEVFLALLDAVGESPYFGVQYDPSNATVGGFDPVAFLEKVKHRVVTMHASDRYLVPGTRLEEIRSQDGTVGYPDKLKHGVTGQGMNDYDAIFGILASVGYSGWISVEDGMDGLDELRRSVEFLKDMRVKYYECPSSSTGSDLKAVPGAQLTRIARRAQTSSTGILPQATGAVARNQRGVRGWMGSRWARTYRFQI